MLSALLLFAAVFTRPLERVTSIDPVMAQAVYDSRVCQLVYETVLNVDYYARPYQLTAGACELPEVSADGLSYVFRVIKGKGLTSADVIRSLERLRDPKAVTPNGWILKGVMTMRALDDYTVEIRLEKRRHIFPWLMAMTPASVLKVDGSGTGPYELVSWRKNHSMTFQRREKSERGFDTVRYLVIDDVTSQWLMFLKGEIDLMGDVTRDNLDAAIGPDGKIVPELAAQGIRLYSVPTLELMYVNINMADPVLGKNKKLRQALNSAFDFPAWQKFYSGRIVEAGGPVPPGVESALAADTFDYRYDLEKAKRLMVEAGYPDGIDPKTGRRLELTLAIGRASQDSREAGELMASFYAKIGIRLELKFYTWDAFLKAVNEGHTQLARIGWVGDYPDAENYLQLFHSNNLNPGPNHSGYINAEYDREYDAAMASETDEERNEHWRNCQRMIREDCPWIFNHVNKSTTLVRSRVGNFIPSDFPYGQEVKFTNEDTVH